MHGMTGMGVFIPFIPSIHVPPSLGQKVLTWMHGMKGMGVSIPFIPSIQVPPSRGRRF
jgi:hypothetical protein